MNRTNLIAIVAVLAVGLCGAGSAVAGTITISANTQGWLNSAGGYSSSSAYIMVGYCGADTCVMGGDGEYRNYFRFRIPTITGTIVSAQLAISQTGADYTRSFDYSPTLTYDVTSIAGGSVTFDHLGEGTSYGSRVFQDSDYSTAVAYTTVYIDLNAQAIQDIMASQNGMFWLSGRVESAESELAASTSSTQPNGWIMAGNSPRQQLIITTADVSSSTPEPASLFLLASGVAVLVLRQRKHRPS